MSVMSVGTWEYLIILAEIGIEKKFKVSDWEKLKFKIFIEGIEILNKDGFTELVGYIRDSRDLICRKS